MSKFFKLNLLIPLDFSDGDMYGLNSLFLNYQSIKIKNKNVEKTKIDKIKKEIFGNFNNKPINTEKTKLTEGIYGNFNNTYTFTRITLTQNSTILVPLLE